MPSKRRQRELEKQKRREQSKGPTGKSRYAKKGARQLKEAAKPQAPDSSPPQQRAAVSTKENSSKNSTPLPLMTKVFSRGAARITDVRGLFLPPLSEGVQQQSLHDTECFLSAVLKDDQWTLSRYFKLSQSGLWVEQPIELQSDLSESAIIACFRIWSSQAKRAYAYSDVKGEKGRIAQSIIPHFRVVTAQGAQNCKIREIRVKNFSRFDHSNL